MMVVYNLSCLIVILVLRLFVVLRGWMLSRVKSGMSMEYFVYDWRKFGCVVVECFVIDDDFVVFDDD